MRVGSNRLTVADDNPFRSSELSSLSNKTLDVHFYEKSFETSQPAAVLAATSTKFGMTAKNIISQSGPPTGFRLIT